MESAIRKRALLDQISLQERNAQDRYIIDESYYRVIAEWEHFAVLTWLDDPQLILTVEKAIPAIAQKFAITETRAEVVLQNLLNSQLIEVQDHRYTKVHDSVHTTDLTSSPALRASHLETLDLGKVKLDQVPLEARDFTSLNFAFDPEQMPELIAIIREFRQKVSALAQTGKKPGDVYQLAIQAYPLSTIQVPRKNDKSRK